MLPMQKPTKPPSTPAKLLRKFLRIMVFSLKCCLWAANAPPRSETRRLLDLSDAATGLKDPERSPATLPKPAGQCHGQNPIVVGILPGGKGIIRGRRLVVGIRREGMINGLGRRRGRHHFRRHPLVEDQPAFLKDLPGSFD